MEYEKIEAWSGNWLKALKDIIESHKYGEDDGIWISKDEAVKMVLEAENILKALTGQDKEVKCLACRHAILRGKAYCKECGFDQGK